MNLGSHLMAGCIAGYLLFFTREIFFIDVFLFIFLSSFMDLDHIVNHFRKKPSNHLRSFMQEPFAIILIGIPLGLLLFWIFSAIIYFWLCILLYFIHISLDYSCVFETYPLDPFNTKIVKREGSGIILPLGPAWKKRKEEFPKTFGEKYLMIIFGVSLVLVIFIYHLVNPGF